MDMRSAVGLLGLLVSCAGTASAAGQVELYGHPERPQLQDRRVFSPDEPHPLIERQHEVQRRTDLINDLPDSRRLRQPAKPKKYKALAATNVDESTSKSTKKSAGRYQVITAPEGTLLLDSQSGRTWRLELRRGDAPVWTPIDREDD
jgi:hypothetical protein